MQDNCLRLWNLYEVLLRINDDQAEGSVFSLGVFEGNLKDARGLLVTLIEILL